MACLYFRRGITNVDTYSDLFCLPLATTGPLKPKGVCVMARNGWAISAPDCPSFRSFRAVGTCDEFIMKGKHFYWICRIVCRGIQHSGTICSSTEFTEIMKMKRNKNVLRGKKLQTCLLLVVHRSCSAGDATSARMQTQVERY